MDIWAVSTILVLWIFLHKSFSGQRCLHFSQVNSYVRNYWLIGQMWVNIRRHCQTVLEMLVVFDSVPNNVESFSTSIFLPTFGTVVIFCCCFSHSCRCEEYLIMVLICISLITGDAEQFLCAVSLDVLFCEVSFCPFFIILFFFSLNGNCLFPRHTGGKLSQVATVPLPYHPPVLVIFPSNPST